MPAITINALRKLVTEAYREGNLNALEMQDSICEKLIKEYCFDKNKESKNEDGWRIYNSYELRSLPLGSIMEHKSRGLGMVTLSGEEKIMAFQDGTNSKFYSNEYPWNEPMKPIGKIII